MNMSNMLDMFAGTYQYGWSSHMLQPHFSTAASSAIFRLLVSRLVFSRISHFSFLVLVFFVSRLSFQFLVSHLIFRFSCRFWFCLWQLYTQCLDIASCIFLCLGSRNTQHVHDNMCLLVCWFVSLHVHVRDV